MAPPYSSKYVGSKWDAPQVQKLLRVTVLRLALVLLALTGCLPLALAQFPTEEPFSTASSGWEGYSEFVRLAQREIGTSRVRPLAQLDYGNLKPNDSLILVRPLRTLDDVSLGEFLADGGRVAVLDDFGNGGSFLQKFGISRVPAPPDPETRLRENADLAVARPSVQIVAGSERGRHPMARHVESVVTNHAVGLRHPDLTSVLEIPSKNGPPVVLAVTGVIAKKGRLFALGDPSVFINLMLRYPGNRRFAEGLVQYLGGQSEDATGTSHGLSPSFESQGKVYILTSGFTQVGRYGDDGSLLEKLLSRFKEMQTTLSTLHKDGLPDPLAIALAAALSLWVFYTQLAGNLRFPLVRSHSFARPPVIAAQTGLFARASVLSSSKTNPILALMELDSALRETIHRTLKVNTGGDRRALTRDLSEAGLPEKEALGLAEHLHELRAYGHSLGEGKPKRPTDNVLMRLHHKTMEYLKSIEQQKDRK